MDNDFRTTKYLLIKKNVSFIGSKNERWVKIDPFETDDIRTNCKCVEKNHYMGDSNSNNNNHDNEKILFSSQVSVNIADETGFQNFTISGYIWVKFVTNNLEVSIDINDCRAGEMLSNKWPLLHKLGIGYFLDSVEIWITPISNTPMSKESLYILKGSPKPWNLNKDIGISEVLEDNHDFGASISRDLGVNFKRGKRNEQCFTSATTEWELIADGCGVTGLGWRYRYISNSPFKCLDRRRNFVPGEHSCHWLTLKEMSGFRITITQVLRCKITSGWRKYNPITRSKLKNLCPKMAHTFEISFNSLKNFNENLVDLKNSEEFQEGRLNVTLSKNSLSRMRNSKNSDIGNIKIKRSFEKFEKKMSEPGNNNNNNCN
ncbi:hypothetical protein Glove_421g121 [Diversispora epigaea]|uniref:Uncharacterized protein n=1 Tax=Diversispora epigaea TaxID=1348612 RepID=A0A397GZC2_9GLOM|nr:hypothetical protein Glove_421g121 [Diversispora epigaea]